MVVTPGFLLQIVSAPFMILDLWFNLNSFELAEPLDLFHVTIRLNIAGKYFRAYRTMQIGEALRPKPVLFTRQ